MAEPPETSTGDAELEDLDESSAGLALANVDMALLRSPVVVRALAGITVATLILIWPERTDRILARLIGLGLVALSATALWAALRRRPLRTLPFLLGLGGLLAGSVLLGGPAQSETALARLVGLVLAVVAIRDLLGHAFGRSEDSFGWSVTRAAALLGGAGLLLLFPNQVFAAATTILAKSLPGAGRRR